MTDRPTGPATFETYDPPRNVRERECRRNGHSWHHESYEGMWLCHCSWCGITPSNGAAAERARIFAALPAALERVVMEGDGWDLIDYHHDLHGMYVAEERQPDKHFGEFAAALVAAIEKSLEQNNG